MRRWGERREEHCIKRGIEIVRVKERDLKKGLGGLELEKRLRGSKWWSEREVSEGHVSDFLNVMRQHGGGSSHG